jgi:UTP--glucose-1-phosphate uridylyltransferase
MRGLGDAVYCARHHINNEPFVILLGDTVVPHEKVGLYGVISGRPISDDLYLIEDLIEKPRPDETPSNLAIAARYAFTPEIFDYIAKTPPGKNGEIQLTDAMRLMLKDRAMYGVTFEGRRFDIGNKLDFLKTNVEFGLTHPEVGRDFRTYIKEIAPKL